MSPPSVAPCSEELYNHLVRIISPKSTSPPVVLETAILPSSSHPTILYDPNCDPPAVGIPKSLLLSCFLRARDIFFSHLRLRREHPTLNGNPDAPTRERTEVYEATAVILLLEPNHLTAINWRRKTLAKQQGARLAELAFLTSLQTSPMPQHAKSSTLWAYRLHILRDDRNVGVAWREELNTVMIAGERHAKNYHAWEYARQVWRLFWAERRGTKSERDRNKSEEDIPIFGECVILIHQWCMKHPRDISGWTFLAFLLQSPPTGISLLEEITRVIERTERFVETLDWKGAGVEWFIRRAKHLKVVEEMR